MFKLPFKNKDKYLNKNGKNFSYGFQIHLLLMVVQWLKICFYNLSLFKIKEYLIMVSNLFYQVLSNSLLSSLKIMLIL